MALGLPQWHSKTTAGGTSVLTGALLSTDIEELQDYVIL
jgi:hypothetical protein